MKTELNHFNNLKIFEGIDKIEGIIYEKIGNVKSFVKDSVKVLLFVTLSMSTVSAETYKIPQMEFEDSLVEGIFPNGLLKDTKDIIDKNGKKKTIRAYNVTSDTITTLADTFAKMGKTEILTEVASKYKNKSLLERWGILKLRLEYYKKIETKITGLSNALDNFRKNKVDMDVLWNEYKKVLNMADFISVSPDLKLSPDVLNEIKALFSTYIKFGELEKYKKELEKEYSVHKKLLNNFIILNKKK